MIRLRLTIPGQKFSTCRIGHHVAMGIKIRRANRLQDQTISFEGNAHGLANTPPSAIRRAIGSVIYPACADNVQANGVRCSIRIAPWSRFYLVLQPMRTAHSITILPFMAQSWPRQHRDRRKTEFRFNHDTDGCRPSRRQIRPMLYALAHPPAPKPSVTQRQNIAATPWDLISGSHRCFDTLPSARAQHRQNDRTFSSHHP